MPGLLPFPSQTGRSFRHFSTTRLTKMATTALSLPYLGEVVAEQEIHFAVKRHRD